MAGDDEDDKLLVQGFFLNRSVSALHLLKNIDVKKENSHELTHKVYF